MRSLAVVCLIFSARLLAQWQTQDAHTAANLRGVAYVGSGIAWASGSNGTVLRTEDMGQHWQVCAIPPGAEHLDFRGIQAFDSKIAFVMSSGKGDLSRLYKTTDRCQSWKLVFTNPDKDGFWDAFVLNRFDKDGTMIGDPVNGRFAVWDTEDKGETWTRESVSGLDAHPGEAIFAASNSALSLDEATVVRFGTGGVNGGRVLISEDTSPSGRWTSRSTPIQHDSDAAGIFSMDYRVYDTKEREIDDDHWVAVGGNYLKPNSSVGSAVFTMDSGQHWQRSTTEPHGYRSAVAYDEPHNTWITVGPSGTDISTDDGRNWRPLKPNPKVGDPPDADQHWNALSLPFVVGPHGRIGKLEEAALARQESTVR